MMLFGRVHSGVSQTPLSRNGRGRIRIMVLCPPLDMLGLLTMRMMCLGLWLLSQPRIRFPLMRLDQMLEFPL